MANPIVIRNSGQAGKVPAVEQMQVGEIALNVADGILYARTDAGIQIIGRSGADLGRVDFAPEQVRIAAGESPYNGAELVAYVGDETLQARVLPESVQRGFHVQSLVPAQATRVRVQFAFTGVVTPEAGEQAVFGIAARQIPGLGNLSTWTDVSQKLVTEVSDLDVKTAFMEFKLSELGLTPGAWAQLAFGRAATDGASDTYEGDIHVIAFALVYS